MSRRSNLFGVRIVAAGLPAWADYTALPMGTFREFTTNKPDDIKPAQYTNAIVNHVFSTWTSAAYVPEFGTYGAIGYHGGGVHDNSEPDLTGVILLDIGSRAYSWSNQSATQRYPWKFTTQIGEPMDNWGHYQADGLSVSPHVWNSIHNVPASWGLTGASGGIARVGHAAGDSTSLNINDSWSSTTVFDIAQTTGGHTRITGSDLPVNSEYTYAAGGPPGSRVQQTGSACVDTVREGWWSKAPPPKNYLNFTHKSGAITSYPSTLLVGPDYPVLHHFAGPDVLVCFGNLTTQQHIWVCRPATDTSWTPITPTFTTTPLIPVEPGFWGMRWSTLLNCFVSLEHKPNISNINPNGLTANFWKLTPPQPLTWASLTTGSWVWSRESTTSQDGSTIVIAAGVESAAYPNGPWGKLLECPPLRAFVWTHRSDRFGQLIRLQGM
jgi:hypothetical protein